MQYTTGILAVVVFLATTIQNSFSEPSPAPAAANKLTVTVQTPDGKPLSHIIVACADSTTNIILKETAISGGRYHFTTDEKGQFEFTVKSETLYFMLATDTGFAVAPSRDLTNNPVMVMQPWGHIEGVRLNNNQPVVNQPILLNLDTRGVDTANNSTRERIYVGNRTTTDSQGRFSFDHVPPGEIALHEEERTKALWNLLTHSLVQPGEHKTIRIATEGRPVTGQTEVSDELPKDLDLTCCRLYLAPVIPHSRMLPATPKEFDAPEKRAQWWDTWYQSEAGQLMFPCVDKRGTDLTILSNGICASDHLAAPGRYHLNGDLVHNKKKIAKVDQYVEIPNDGNNQSGDPFNIGKILLKPSLQEGSLVPDFDFKTLDGAPLKLASLRGKYVLLDFWATWCGPCVAETPYLKATYEAFEKDNRLATVSLSLDEDSAAPKKFVREKDIHWIQGFLGDWEQDTVTKALEINSIPSIWLIAPDGKVISRNLRGPKIKEAVAAALAAK